MTKKTTARTKATKVTSETGEYRPSEAALRKARKVIAGYTIEIQPDEDGTFVGWARELPTVFADGTTRVETARAIEFALETALAAMIEEGVTPPTSRGEGKRTEQVNIRLTQHEKQVLARESSRRGFRGVADLIRAQTVERLVR